MLINFKKKINSGFVWINTYFQMFPSVGFGGWKNSGFGKDGGKESLHQWSVQKAIVQKFNEE